MESSSPGSALVIGAGMAGLLAARVLSEHFREVAILDRDLLFDTPESRKGVPQSFHPHLLLIRGLEALEHLLPGLCEDLVAAGVTREDGNYWRFVTPAGAVVPVDLGRPLFPATRATLETCVRRRVEALPEVRFVPGAEVTGLVYSAEEDAVTGARVRHRDHSGRSEATEADLVVDASGRNSKVLAWLQEMGYGAPPQETVNAGIGYSSRFYRRPESGSSPWRHLLIQPCPPQNPRLGALISVEGGRWHVMLGGVAEQYPPTDEPGFLDWARSLADPALYEAICDAEPLTPIRGFRTPTTHRRRFERMRRWPGGLIVLGDALCAFNPIYGQGMSVAALEAEALERVLRRDGLPGWERRFQKRAARVAADPWAMATGEDLRWPSVRTNGRTARRSTRLLHRYMDRLMQAACADPVVSKAFLSAVNLLVPPQALTHPRVLLRVLRHTARGAAAPAEVGFTPRESGPSDVHLRAHRRRD